MPNVMANALRLHPLLVIFGLLAGGELYGIAGVLVALPTMAAGRAIWEFFGERVELEPWEERRPAARARGRASSHPGASQARRPHPARRGEYPCAVSFPVDPPPAAAAHRRAARARPRDPLSLDDFVMPLFACPGEGVVRPVDGLPGHRAALGRRARARGRGARARSASRAVLLFGIPEEKDEEGSGAWDEDGIVQRALRALRAEVPGLVLADRRLPLRVHRRTATAACSATATVDNDATLELLARTAVSHVEAGADVVCPSDMMDGRVGAIRAALPRDADRLLRRQVRVRVLRPVPRGRRVGAVVRRPARLPDGSRERARGAARVRARPRRGRRRADGQAGAAVPRRDPRGARALRLPGRGLQRLRRVRDGAGGRARRAHLDERAAALESLTAIKRAGAGTIVTYWAKDLAGWL